MFAPQKTVLAIVGMSGSGKSEASKYLQTKGFQGVRFGDLTDEGLKEFNLTYSAENEKMFREKIRKELGMAAFAIKAKPKIDELLKTNDKIVLDGLYSWEEYKYLTDYFPDLILVYVFADRNKRYERLSKRKIRPLGSEEAKKRDISEIENLSKGGPIAIADYLVENNGDQIADLGNQLDMLLEKIEIYNKQINK